MQTVTLEPLRWQEPGTRVTVVARNGHPQAFFQVTSALDVPAMARGRPVEELPRILAILGPAHHVAAAMALDELFEVEPPKPAENMRCALLQTFILIHHLDKIAFLLMAQTHPFAELRVARKSERILHGLLDDVMHARALAREAARILGGRSDHPITAVAGGMSRFLKNNAYQHLAEIAEGCLAAAERISAACNETVLAPRGLTATLGEIGVSGLPYLSAAAPTESTSPTICLKENDAETIAQFAPAEIADAIGMHREPWTHAHFAFIKERGWPGLPAENTDGLYFVGPLARLYAGRPLDTPLAEAARSRMIAARGATSPVDVAAAYRALLVEILHAAEQMPQLLAQEKFLGPAIRRVPTGLAAENAAAAVESPRGLVVHRYRVDSNGIVQDAQVLDTTAQNNALFGLLTQKAVEVARQQKASWKQTRTIIELSLLPF